MVRRIDRARGGAGAVVGGLATLVLTACGLRVPIEVQPTPSPTGSPSPSATPSPTTSPSASGTTASPTTPPSTSPPASPKTTSSTPAPRVPRSPTPTPTSTPEATPQVVVGRPLRQRRRVLLPDVTRGDAPVHPDATRLGTLPAPLREPLAALWLGAARGEHASVPAFAEVALLLSAAGAPLDLVAAAHRAALDEVEHTRLSYALANAYGGTAHAPGPLPRLLGRRLGTRRRRAVDTLAVEALREGCLNEGYAAAVAASGAEAATDPAARAALRAIAADEASHADLSWRILGWALATGGPAVRKAVTRTLRALPDTAPAPTPRADLATHGWPAPETAAAAYAGVLATVTERARGLLALSGQQVPVQ